MDVTEFEIDIFLPESFFCVFVGPKFDTPNNYRPVTSRNIASCKTGIDKKMRFVSKPQNRVHCSVMTSHIMKLNVEGLNR